MKSPSNKRSLRSFLDHLLEPIRQHKQMSKDLIWQLDKGEGARQIPVDHPCEPVDPFATPSAEYPPIRLAQSDALSGPAPTNVSALPPVDTGRRAWLFLAGATMMEFLVWGLPFSIGVLHTYWAEEYFKGQGESTITLAATLQTGLLYMSTSIFGPVLAAYPHHRALLQVIGLIGGSGSIIASAFVTKPWHLIVTIGLFYPMLGATYLPCATLIFEWFLERRGLASGILYAGTGAGGAVFPFLVSGLLSRFGYRATMVSLGIGFLCIGSISLIPVRRRIPLTTMGNPSQRVTPPRRPWRSQWRFLQSKSMLIGGLVILFIGLGNFVPSLWIPSYANDLKMSRPGGTGLVAIMNAAAVPGNAAIGHLTDRWPMSITIFVSSAVTAASCLLLWGFGTSNAVLIVFSIVYGTFGLSFTALWTRMISIISRDDPHAPQLVFSIFAFLRGVGNITSGPISDALLKLETLQGAAGAYGFRNYGILIVFTGVSILLGGLAGLWFPAR